VRKVGSGGDAVFVDESAEAVAVLNAGTDGVDCSEFRRVWQGEVA
jgi:hypothetical protein